MLRKRPRNSRSLVRQQNTHRCDVDEGKSGSGSAEQALRLALERQAVLAKEADHRIKNSLGLVASMLGLQRAQLSDQTAKEILGDSITRIMTVAEVHRSFQESAKLGAVAAGKMIRDLCQRVGQLSSTVDVQFQTEEESVLDARRAIPLALVVAELLTNALKHAYPTGRAGTVRVELRTSGDVLLISVTDTGVGVDPARFVPEAMGMRFTRELCDQIGARLDVETGPRPGTTITVSMRLGQSLGGESAG
jgi:two-component sensor histidine kinase